MAEPELYRFEPNCAVPPGETLSEILVGMGTATLASMSTLTIDEIQGVLHATTPVTEELADKLNKATGISVQFWLNMEKNYRADLARLEVE